MIRTALLLLALTAAPLAAAAQEGPRAPDFDEIDANRDGILTPDEIRGRLAGAAAARFAAADRDGDGRLTAEELAASRLSRVREQGTARAARLVERLDVDGDGALTPDEIRSALGERAGPRRGGGLERLDTDGDGGVSRGEWEARPSREGRRGGGFRRGG